MAGDNANSNCYIVRSSRWEADMTWKLCILYACLIPASLAVAVLVLVFLGNVPAILQFALVLVAIFVIGYMFGYIAYFIERKDYEKRRLH